jgi:hypothetical protein
VGAAAKSVFPVCCERPMKLAVSSILSGGTDGLWAIGTYRTFVAQSPTSAVQGLWII